jgi:RimJ/RimL family protein N-acetyltransferase
MKTDRRDTRPALAGIADRCSVGRHATREDPLIRTERLELVPATVVTAQAALDGPEPLAAALHAVVPDTWPPDLLDEPALQFTLARLAASITEASWWMYFIILPGAERGRTLIGSAGYKGPPTADGTVEVGYGIVRDRQRRGYASEATRGLVARAFQHPEVRRVIAETLPELTPSIGVLRRCGFRFIGEGSEAGVIRYEITREAYTETPGGSAWPS